MFRRLANSLEFNSNGDVFIQSKVGIGTYDPYPNIEVDIRGDTTFSHGNVGFGTSAPSAPIHIHEKMRLANNHYAYRLAPTSTSNTIQFFSYTPDTSSNPIPNPTFQIRLFGTVIAEKTTAAYDIMFAGDTTHGITAQRASRTGSLISATNMDVTSAFAVKFYRAAPSASPSTPQYIGYIVINEALTTPIAYELNFETLADTFAYQPNATIDTANTTLIWDATENITQFIDPYLNQIGIGTATAAARLHITSSNSPVLHLQADPTSSSTLHPIAKITPSPLVPNATHITIDAAARLGIGTTQPTTGLHVHAQDVKILGGANLGIGTQTPQASLHVYHNARIDGTLTVPRLTANVGIGTTDPNIPNALHVMGSAYATSLLAENAGIMEGGAIHVHPLPDRMPTYTPHTKFIEVASNEVHLWTPGSDPAYTAIPAPPPKLSILPSGNVGIGTTTPNATLHTVGDALITQTLGIGTTVQPQLQQTTHALYVHGSTLVSGDILPSQCNIYNLGASNARFNDLYISDATIDINGLEVKSLEGNTLYVLGNQLQTFPRLTSTFTYPSTSNIPYPTPVFPFANSWTLDASLEAQIANLHSGVYGTYVQTATTTKVQANSIQNYGEPSEHSPTHLFDDDPETQWITQTTLTDTADASPAPSLTLTFNTPIRLYSYAMTLRSATGYFSQSPIKWRIFGLTSAADAGTLLQEISVAANNWTLPGETQIFAISSGTPTAYPIYRFDFLRTAGTNFLALAKLELHDRFQATIAIEHHDHLRKLIHSTGNFTEHAIETIATPSLELPSSNLAVRLEASSFLHYPSIAAIAAASPSAPTTLSIKHWDTASLPAAARLNLTQSQQAQTQAYVSFDASSNQYAHLPTFALAADSFTITAHIKINASAAPMTVFDLGNAMNTDSIRLTLLANGTATVHFYDNSTNFFASLTTSSILPIPRDTWILLSLIKEPLPSMRVRLALTTPTGSQIIGETTLPSLPLYSTQPRTAARIAAAHGPTSSSLTNPATFHMGAFYIHSPALPDRELMMLYKYLMDIDRAITLQVPSQFQDPSSSATILTETNRLNEVQSDQLEPEPSAQNQNAPSRYHFNYPAGFVSLNQMHYGSIDMMGSLAIRENLTVTKQLTTSNLFVPDTITTSNLNILTDMFYNYDSRIVRTNLQPQPISQTMRVSSPTMTSNVFLIDGIYNFSPYKASICVNGIKLAYLSSNIYDFDLVTSLDESQSHTVVTVNFTQPIYEGDVVDFTLWPDLVAQDAEQRPGILVQNIIVNPSEWTMTLANSNIWYKSGNVGIGTSAPRALLDIGRNLVATEESLLRFNTQSPWELRAADELSLCAEELGSTFIVKNNLNEPIATFQGRDGGLINTNRLGVGTASPVATLHVHGASFLNGKVGINTTQSDPNSQLFVNGNIVSSGTITAADLNVLGTFTTVNTQVSTTDSLLLQNSGTATALTVIQSGSQPVATFVYGQQQSNIALHIAQNGSVAIGHSNAAAAALDVVGGVHADVFFGDGSQLSNLPFNWYANENGDRYAIANIGIGTTLPTATLDVVGNVKATTFFGDGSQLSNLPISSQWVTAPATSNIYLPPSSNVGIGTATPMETLDVFGTVKATAFAGDGYALTNLPVVSSQWVTALATPTPSIYFPPSSNVGIGTTSPTETLDVLGTVKATTFIGDGSQLENLPISSQWVTAPSTPTPSIYLPSSSNVGIGTATPTTTLDVLGTVKATAFIGDGNALINLPVVSSQWVTAPSTPTPSIYLPSSSNVGIGTTLPTAKLDVLGTVKATAFTGDGNALTNLPVISSQWVTVTATSNIYLPPSSNVGIGTTAPTAKLDVLGTVKATAFAGDGNALTNLPISSQWVTVAATSNIYLPPSSNVGIGTTLPTAKLDVQGTVKATTFIGDGSQLNNLPISSQWVTVAATSNIYLPPSSNVGIGTTSPTAKLDVMGDINFTGQLFQNGNPFTTSKSELTVFNDTTQTVRHASSGIVVNATSNYYVGTRITWTTPTTSAYAKIHLSGKCSIAGNASENAYRRYETIVDCKNDAGQAAPKAVLNVETANAYSTAFSGLTHEVVRASSNAVDVKVKWSSSFVPYVVNSMFEIVAPVGIGTVSYSNIYGSFV